MMDNLRTAANSIVIKIILILIIISFVFTGVSGYIFGNSNGYAAKVNGQEISKNQLEQAIQIDSEQLRRQLGGKYNEYLANAQLVNQRRQNVLQQLIDETLIQQYVNKLKLSISKEQIRSAIRAEPAFQNNGQFDNTLYRQVLAANLLGSEQFAENIALDLRKNQLVDAYTKTDFVLPTELENQAALDMQKRHVRLATIKVGDLVSKQVVLAEEIESYYQQNKSLFALPERIKVSYIEINAGDTKSKISEKDIIDYYQRNKPLYTQAKRYYFSVIQQKTEQAAQGILTKLKAGADFATLATEMSIDPSSKSGGRLDGMEEHNMNTDMVNAKLTEAGQISDIIKSEDSKLGYLIFKLNHVQSEKIQSLPEVKNKITQQLQDDKSKTEYYALQQKIGDAIHNDPYSLVSAEQVSNLAVVETNWFTKTTIPEKLQDPTITQLIFSGSLLGKNGAPAANSDLLQISGDHAFVLRIADHQPASVKSLNSVRDQVIRSVQQQKAQQQAIKQAEKIVAKLQTDKSASVAELEFDKPSVLSLQVNMDPLETVIFQLPQPKEGEVSYTSSMNADGDVVVVALDKVEKGKLSAEMKDSYQQQTIMLNGYKSIESLIQNRRQQAKILIM